MMKKIKQEDINSISIKKIEKVINDHVRETFEKATVVKQYEIEVKNKFTVLATHGSSNYQIYNKEKIIKTKMRSYKNEEYVNIDINTKEIKDNYSRAERWLDTICKNPSQVDRQEPFVEDLYIKTKNYRQQKERIKKFEIEVVI
uniref:Uncharacterized protein n=1 Tax=Lophocladia kuetzingii TaxID=675577 RepID=A0A1Z1MPJ7_9FLOR|nr:hypothetical protein [Lophocladia kuetzingii]ARW67684.1 hypothetical protein [Lophocladia kuetzingii]